MQGVEICGNIGCGLTMLCCEQERACIRKQLSICLCDKLRIACTSLKPATGIAMKYNEITIIAAE
jgi:hypothetical protein